MTEPKQFELDKSTAQCACGSKQFELQESTTHLAEIGEDGKIYLSNEQANGFAPSMTCVKCGATLSTEDFEIEY